MNLRSNPGTWELIENKVPGLEFTNECFKCCAPHLYNTLSKTIHYSENFETFKKILKTYKYSVKLST